MSQMGIFYKYCSLFCHRFQIPETKMIPLSVLVKMPFKSFRYLIGTAENLFNHGKNKYHNKSEIIEKKTKDLE